MAHTYLSKWVVSRKSRARDLKMLEKQSGGIENGLRGIAGVAADGGWRGSPP